MDQIAYNDYGQATSIRIGGGTANPLTEQYSFDANTGLMTNQKVKRGATSLMDLSYNYARGNSKGSLSGTTGNLTNIVNNLDRNKDRKFEFDTLGRLTKALGGVAAGGSGVANWTQTYTFDRYGNKLTTAKSGITANSAAIPLDGLASQTYAATTNRITNSGTEYDNAGNQTRGAAPNGTLQRFEFDEAGRIKVIKTDAGAAIETNTYATSRERLIKETSTDRTYYAWGGSSVLAEFTEAIASSTPSWAKSYIYAGSRLLSTITKNGSAELTEYHHPDRLGTKAVSDTTANTFKEQATLPFGAMIDAETVASTNQKFTSYDRSGATGLDYAVNRTYNSGQSRFTQVDPIGMASASLGNPQSMNLFAYTENNPVDFTDSSGLDSEPPKIRPKRPRFDPWVTELPGCTVVRVDETWQGEEQTFHRSIQCGDGKPVQPQTNPRLGTGVPTNILAIVKEIAERERCADMINRIKKALSSFGKPWEPVEGESFINTVFNSLKSITINPKRVGGNDAKIAGGDVFLQDRNFTRNGSKETRGDVFVDSRFGMDVLEEMVHRFKKGNYNDEQLTKAGKKVFEAGGLDETTLENLRSSTIGAHQLIGAACKYSIAELEAIERAGKALGAKK